jgi:hypothetical protein
MRLEGRDESDKEKDNKVKTYIWETTCKRLVELKGERWHDEKKKKIAKWEE